MKKTMPSTKKATPTKRKAPADKNTSVTKQKSKNSESSRVASSKAPPETDHIVDYSITNAVQSASKKMQATVTSKKKSVTKHTSAAKGALKSVNKKNQLPLVVNIKRYPKPSMAVPAEESVAQVTAEPKSNVPRKRISSKKTAARRPAIVADNKLGVPAVAERK
jgi:hypothetical protein